ncbi:MAG: hypothetical protein ACRDFQ_00525 [Anaerolineales bacterium]
MNLKGMPSDTRLLVLALGVVIIANTAITSSGLQNPLALLRDITKNGLWRSANNAYSQRAANFYEFLNNEIPEDSRVLIPSRGNGPGPLTYPDVTQFFLYPREVINCSTPIHIECARGFANTGTAILITNLDEFAEDAQFSAHLRPFDNQWAVYSIQASSEGPSQQDFSGLWAVALAFLQGVLFYVLLAAPWTYFSILTLPSLGPAVHLAVGFGTGIGWQSLALTLLLMAGVPPTAPAVLTVAALPLGIAMLHYRWSRKEPFRFNQRVDYRVIGFFLLILAVSSFFSVGRGYKVVDEIVLWGAKGYGIVAAGLQRGATEWGTITTKYPLNIPLTISSSLLLFGDRLPEAKLAFPMFAAALIALIYESVKSKSNTAIALLAGAVIFTTPMIFIHSTIAYANLPLAFYLLAGTTLLNHEVPRKKNMEAKFAASWGAVMLILAAWTRPEGLLIAWALPLIGPLISRRVSRKKGYYWNVLAPLAVYSVFWTMSSRFIYTRPGFTSGVYGRVLSGMSSGDLHVSELAYIIRSQFIELFTLSEWGLSSFLLAFSIIALAFIKPRDGSTRTYYLAGFLTVGSVLAIYYAFSYLNRPQDISWWVNTGLSRMTMPGILLIMTGAFTDLGARFSTETVKVKE